MRSRPKHKTSDLQSSAMSLRSAADLISETLFFIDRDHRIILANNAAQTMAGLPESALLDQPIETILSLQGPRQRTRPDRIKLASADLLTIPAKVHGATYSASFLPITSEMMFAQFTPRPAALVIVRPIAAPHMQEHTTATIYLQILGQLTMRVVHDLSNSLTSIIGNADLVDERLTELVSAPSPDKIALLRENGLPELQDVIRKSREMAQFINTLREYARQQPFHTSTLDLNTAINDMLGIARSLLGSKIQIDFLPSDELPKIYIDRLRLDQVFLSILITCRNAMPSGGRITVATERVTLDQEFTLTHRGARAGTYTRLSITDSSAGMDSEQVKGLFDFHRTDESFDSDSFALPIVYSIVKRFSGYIDVESWPGKGTRFDIYIPPIPPMLSTSVISAQAGNYPRALPDPIGPGPVAATIPAAASTRILVAEDDSDIQRTIVRCVAKAGYETTVTADGKAALEIYRQLAAQGNPPALLITDLGLPGLDGRTLCKTIRTEFPSAQILLTSGYKIEMDPKTGKTQDGFHFLQKPFEPNGLLRQVERLLSTKGDRQNQSLTGLGSPARYNRRKRKEA